MLFLSWKSDFKKAAYDLVLKPQDNGILNQVFFFFFLLLYQNWTKAKAEKRSLQGPTSKGSHRELPIIGSPWRFLRVGRHGSFFTAFPQPLLEFKWEGDSSKDWNHQVAGLMLRAVFLEFFSSVLLECGGAKWSSKKIACKNQECLKEEPSIPWWNTCWVKSSGSSPWCCLQNMQGLFWVGGMRVDKHKDSSDFVVGIWRWETIGMAQIHRLKSHVMKCIWEEYEVTLPCPIHFCPQRVRFRLNSSMGFA